MRKSQKSALFIGSPIEQTPPPYAYDYQYNDALVAADTVLSTEVTFPSYFCGNVDPVVTCHSFTVTTQNYSDTIPLTWGKHKGATPQQIAKVAPDYIVWCEENLPAGKCPWSAELYETCKELVKSAANTSGRR